MSITAFLVHDELSPTRPLYAVAVALASAVGGWMRALHLIFCGISTNQLIVFSVLRVGTVKAASTMASRSDALGDRTKEWKPIGE